MNTATDSGVGNVKEIIEHDAELMKEIEAQILEKKDEVLELQSKKKTKKKGGKASDEDSDADSNDDGFPDDDIQVDPEDAAGADPMVDADNDEQFDEFTPA